MDQSVAPKPEIETVPRGRAALRFVRQLAFALISIVVLIIIFGILNPRFLSAINWFHITQQVAVIAILAIGQTFIIATAGIDISQGSVVALSSMICAIILVDTHLGMIAAVALTLLLGAVVGAIVGGSIVVLGVPPFIATLGMLAIAMGAALLTTNGTPVFGLPNGFQAISQGTILGVPNMGWIAIVIALIAATLAIGSNAEAARRVGINVPRHLLMIYMLGGIISALAGIVYLSYTAAAQPTSGGNYELYAIAAVVIGGGSLFGGVGTILGSVLGALLMTILKNGTQLAGISSYVEQVILGIVVVGAVYVDNLRRRLR
ncbi:ABC transporter permease [Acidiphilium sp. 34-64-41]|uniref:ABC transporter permease n=1 Tax=Acidiphilium sp. 34-64-41 TaxID=1970297 RepID=UPI000BCBFD91|nr:ABC transporter permease [Acidiphilium sp. 34-64-41]OZB29516.1 MAG: ATPase [Acidiphilium sp. 34-64-41]